MSNPVDEWTDAFGNQLARITHNDADLASHYNYSPERYRVYVDGSRKFPQYNSVSQLEDNRTNEEDVFVLTPSAGETVRFHTAERYRYTVNFVAEVTQALAVNQSLSGDDTVIGGLDTSPSRDKSDGYFFEHTSSHADDEIDLFKKRNGSVLGEKQTVSLGVPFTTFQRLENAYNWYNVGVSNWVETFTEAYGQLNTALASLNTRDDTTNAGPGGRGPISGNGCIFFEVTADSGTSGLELYAGSAGYTSLGATEESRRVKGGEKVGLGISTTDTWVPLFVLRKDLDRPLVNLQLSRLEMTEGQGKVMGIACDPSNVKKGGTSPTALTDSDFSTPEEQNATNSVVETTDGSTVTHFPDSSGSTTQSADEPGGYQVGWNTNRSYEGETTRSSEVQEKYGVYDGDYIVLVAKPSNTTDISLSYITEQDW
jgi:hypothetical protein